MNLILLFESDFSDANGTRARLRGRRKEHALTICKASAGDTLRVGLLNGNLGIGLVTEVNDRYLELSVTLNDPPPPPLPLTLVMALPRPKVLRRCLEAISSMGVKKVFIIGSWRVEKSYWSSPALNEKNMRDHLLLGLEQGRDTVLPHIELRQRFKPFVQDELPVIIKGSRSLLAHPGAAIPCPCCLTVPVTLAIGPEGGFIQYEIDLFEKLGFEQVALGQRVLRTENALPALVGRLF
ncbi:MAG: 16S rRNA (uracil(1498)-N(3))-methyltransferase [Chitinispirillaceae bacterium]|nr:16S rRNA (uracil(1498)-N(3))-methyltransferase [Chitinispirillaceae bacterium]